MKPIRAAKEPIKRSQPRGSVIRAAMVAKVGDDAYGLELIANLERADVDTAAMEQVAGPSGLAPIYVADDGRNAIVVVPGANGKMDRAVVDKHAELIRSAGMVLCQLEIPMDTLELYARVLRAGQACR